VINQPDQSGSLDADDADIPNDDVLYRRLSYDGGAWVVYHPVTGQRRASSGGFTHDTDGVSVFRQSLLLAHNPPLDPSNVALRPDDVVVGFTVGDVRSLQLGVRNDLWPKDVPDPDHPRYGAHALILGLGDLGKSARVKKQKKLVDLPSMTFVHG
jgi:hypothetical protein